MCRQACLECKGVRVMDVSWGGLHRASRGRRGTQAGAVPPAPLTLLHSPLTGQPKVAPTVNLFPPSSEQLNTGKATLVCLLADFYPGSVEVTWSGDGTSITNGVETGQPQQQSNGKYFASSYLTLSASDWKSRETYSCKVQHDAGNVEKTLKRSECS